VTVYTPNSNPSERGREVRMELLRPDQLIRERERCPLLFIPLGLLEYHGPHLPLGVDAIHASWCAIETCRRLGKGVVSPTVYCGTERERPEWMLQSLGFSRSQWIVGMDFPTATWKSHYQSEQFFGLALANELEMMIAHGYRVIVVANGHGAWNQVTTLDRLCRAFSHNTDCLVVHQLASPAEVSEKNQDGHADLYETALMLYYQKHMYGDSSVVDLGRLPAREVPIHYQDFSIVDGSGFSEHPSPGRIVQSDPRDATLEQGRRFFEQTVEMYLEVARGALQEKGLD
jgi:creatinine amidohydrolase